MGNKNDEYDIKFFSKTRRKYDSNGFFQMNLTLEPRRRENIQNNNFTYTAQILEVLFVEDGFRGIVTSYWRVTQNEECNGLTGKQYMVTKQSAYQLESNYFFQLEIMNLK